MTGLIQIPYWWHATAFEVLWLVAGVLGGAITSVNVWDSIKDRKMLAEVRNDPAVHDRHWKMISLAAHSRESSQVTRLVICALITLSGVVGVTQANPLGGATTWTGFIVTLTLIAIAALTAARSWFDYRERGQMLELAMGRSSVIAAKLKAQALREQEAGSDG